jgi:hypothetical protein
MEYLNTQIQHTRVEIIQFWWDLHHLWLMLLLVFRNVDTTHVNVIIKTRKWFGKFNGLMLIRMEYSNTTNRPTIVEIWFVPWNLLSLSLLWHLGKICYRSTCTRGFWEFLLRTAKFFSRMQLQIKNFMKDTFDESATWYYQYRSPTSRIAAYDIQNKGEWHDSHRNAPR